MKISKADVIVVGAGGAGLRAAVEVASKGKSVALVSKVYPMRSHTCAAEGGAAAVIQAHDDFETHFNDTVTGGDYLADQDTVERFVKQAPTELENLNKWGCPWSRTENGKPAFRAFGGMKVERTWYAADKTGFHVLHTLFQTSIQYENITRFDEYFFLDLIVENGKCHGIIALHMASGEVIAIIGKAVILATGGAGRVYKYNTNGGIVTGEGMGVAYKNGAYLRDMEFVQYHPTTLPGSGILMTEGCRGEGGYLLNKDGYRYLQDYGLGPVPEKPTTKKMELSPRDKISQCFWQEEKKGRVSETKWGKAVWLDLRHLGKEKLYERLPFICELAKIYVNVDPVKELIPVRPSVHYTMGGIETDINGETNIQGLFAIGECGSSGLHGANRLGSNSLTELFVYGQIAGESAVERIAGVDFIDESKVESKLEAKKDYLKDIVNRKGNEKLSTIRDEMRETMEKNMGIYRDGNGIQESLSLIAELKERAKNIQIDDKSEVFNTDMMSAVELENMLEIAEVMCQSALNREESRGAHQRLDFPNKNVDKFHKHTRAEFSGSKPKLTYTDVRITKIQHP